MPEECPDLSQYQSLLEGSLADTSPAAFEPLARHLELCERCGRAAEELMSRTIPPGGTQITRAHHQHLTGLIERARQWRAAGGASTFIGSRRAGAGTEATLSLQSPPAGAAQAGALDNPSFKPRREIQGLSGEKLLAGAPRR